MDLTNEQLMEMYRDMAKSRVFAQKMEEAARRGLIRCSFHSPIGQEGGAVALMNALRDTDWIAPSHRMQGALLKRMDAYPYICELVCRRDGFKLGTNFDFHANNLKNRVLIPTGIMGSNAPVYTGFAWGRKDEGTDEVVAICTGDGATSEGCVAEAWNIAKLHKAPVLFVIENNGWAISVPIERQSPNPNLAEKAAPYHMQTQIVDGSDVLACREAMERGLELARKGEPNVIELKYIRWGEHFVGEPGNYRTDNAEREKAMQEKDCLKNYERYLMEKGLLTQEYSDEYKKNLAAEFDEMLERVATAPLASKEEIFTKENIYATPETGGDL